MKEKILAILRSDTDVDIKVGLIEDLKYQIADEDIMAICNEYLIFSANRNELLVKESGLLCYADDCLNTTDEQIWEDFKKYLKIKNEIQNN